MLAVEADDPVIACFEHCVQRYGCPEGAMSDRGSAFHSRRGLSRFEAQLEEYEANYLSRSYLARGIACGRPRHGGRAAGSDPKRQRLGISESN